LLITKVPSDNLIFITIPFGKVSRKKETDNIGRGTFVGGDEYLQGVEFQYKRTGGWRLLVEPDGAEVLAVDNEDYPLILSHRYGRGKILFATEPLEYFLSMMPDVYPANKFYLFYNYLYRLAGVVNDVYPDPCIENIKLTSGENWTLIHDPKPVKCRYIARQALAPEELPSALSLAETGK
jgi:hypothetical protein